MEELTQLHWIALLGGALIMGLSKGGIPGAGNLTVAIYALTLEDAFGPAGVALVTLVAKGTVWGCCFGRCLTACSQ